MRRSASAPIAASPIIRISAGAGSAARRSTRASPATACAARPTSRGSSDPNYAYTPFVPPAEANVKVPAWLNDPIYYHNRGNTEFRGESSLLATSSGLDDLMTENPRVVQGMIDIYGAWIDRYGVDGFRIDTAQHVNPEFWQAFVPAMLEARAARGIPNFHIFGEVAAEGVDPAQLRATHARRQAAGGARFRLRRRGAAKSLAGKQGTDGAGAAVRRRRAVRRRAPAALRLPTFLGNHDSGRFALARRSAPGRMPATTRCCSA